MPLLIQICIVVLALAHLAIARGVKLGTGLLLGRWMVRLTRSRFRISGGNHHE